MDDPAPSPASSDPAANVERTGDLLYDAFYGAAIGGATIAFFFLAVDIIRARPLFTPSLMGQVLFGGADPASVSVVRLDMVAYFTVVHLVGFLVLGWIIAYVCQVTGLARNLPVVTGLVFAVLTLAFFAADFLVLGGVAAVIGIPNVLVANLLTALAMGLFLRRAHA